MSTDQAYIGQELTIFAHATSWKRYYTSLIRPFFGKHVVEVGAGLGSTTSVMCDGTQTEWVCLEPDPLLRVEIDKLVAAGKLPKCCRTQGGFVADMQPGARVDTFIYIDVLEHIEDDKTELGIAADRLAPDGRLIVLSPAFQFLFSPFDKSIGHYRRYDRSMFHSITPHSCRLEKLVYLDSVGMGTSLVNRFLLSQSMPTVKQIKFWDRYFIPVARWTDWLIRYSFGRSLLGIWVKQ